MDTERLLFRTQEGDWLKGELPRTSGRRQGQSEVIEAGTHDTDLLSGCEAGYVKADSSIGHRSQGFL
jgi:hypothetical protein